MAQQAATAHPATLREPAHSWSEDWLAVAVGAGIFALALALLFGANLLGWAAAPRIWLDIANSVRPASQAYAQWGPAALLLATFGFMLTLMTASAALLRTSFLKFVASFTVVFWLAYLCWVVGSY